MYVRSACVAGHLVVSSVVNGRPVTASRRPRRWCLPARLCCRRPPRRRRRLPPRRRRRLPCSRSVRPAWCHHARRPGATTTTDRRWRGHIASATTTGGPCGVCRSTNCSDSSSPPAPPTKQPPSETTAITNITSAYCVLKLYLPLQRFFHIWSNYALRLKC